MAAASGKQKKTVRYFIIAGVSNLDFDGSWGFLVS